MKQFKQKFGGMASNFYWSMGVDFGSSNTAIYLKDRGVIVDEPSLVARHRKKRWTGLSAPKVSLTKPVAFGTKAKEMLSREPQQIEVVAPIKNGIVSDLAAAEMLVAHYLRTMNEIPSKYPKLLKPKVLAGVPCSITEVQKRAVKSIFKSMGASEVVLIEDAILGALGAGLPVESSSGLMVVDVGGGKTEVSVVSLGGVVVGAGIKTAGNDMDLAIINFIKMKYGLLIGQNTAEKIKIEVGNILPEKGQIQETTVIRGRDLATGLPKSVRVAGGEIVEALSMEIARIVRLVKEVLDQTPPEMMEDILRRGIVLIGKGSLLKGLDRMIEAETRIVTKTADDAGSCVIRGLGILIEDDKSLNQVKLVLGS